MQLFYIEKNVTKETMRIISAIAMTFFLTIISLSTAFCQNEKPSLEKRHTVSPKMFRQQGTKTKDICQDWTKTFFTSLIYRSSNFGLTGSSRRVI